jgi:hypothetical protein
MPATAGHTGLLLLTTIALLSACEHTEPPALPDYGAIGGYPIAGFGAGATWTDDGAAFLLSDTCLTNQTPKGQVYAAALSIIPVGGGSITWQRCELLHATRVPPDSQGGFWAQALGSDGRLLYLESITLLEAGANPFPIFTHSDLWLTDSAYPLSRRQKLLALYYVDSTGLKAIPDSQVDWLLNHAWAGQGTFVALGANLLARLDSYQPTPLRVVRGTIGTNGASLDAIAGTDRARMYSMAESNETVVFNRDSLAVERVPIGGGSATVVATLPALAGRVLIDISCKAELCLLLTQETDSSSHTQSTFWTLPLDTGAVTALRSYSAALTSAKISPGSNAVLASGFLFTDLLH